MLDSARRAADALDPTPFGCNSHLAPDAMIASLAGIGVRWQRFDADWNAIEPREGVFAWNDLDRCVAAAARNGVSVYATIAYTPSWASGSDQRAAPPRQGADFVRFARHLARRYRGRIQALGVWNEPNLEEFYLGTRAFYLDQLLRPGLEAIREEAPEIATCGPDLSSSHSVDSWLGDVLRVAGDLLDVVTHHQYDGGDTVLGRARQIDRLRAFLVSQHFGDRPLWITETGLCRSNKVSPEQQADYLHGIYVAMEQRTTWWRKTFWYDSHGACWGLFGADGQRDAGQPWPAFDTYRQTIAELQPLPVDDVSLGVVVEHAYQGILARPADAAGREAYVRSLALGRPTLTLCAELFASDEFARTRAALGPAELAAQLYRGILERPGDAEGLAQTVAALRAGGGPARAAQMLESPEFAARFLARGPK